MAAVVMEPAPGPLKRFYDLSLDDVNRIGRRHVRSMFAKEMPGNMVNLDVYEASSASSYRCKSANVVNPH